MTIDWGTRSDWELMKYIDKIPGIGWDYEYSTSREDSAFTSVRTGDKLVIYVTGNEGQIWKFKIVVNEPTDGANIVIPKNSLNTNPRSNSWNEYQGDPFEVTVGAFGMDTIYDVSYGTRVDSLLKYLEKAPEATWMVDMGGDNRPDLMDGDKLVVTAKNGSVKKYYIKVNSFVPSHTATLSTITWPDIPDFYRGIFGWTGDTIPNFGSTAYDYSIEIPSDVEGIPAFDANTTERNATFSIMRAKNLTGSLADRTVKIHVVAEDDTTMLDYSIALTKQKNPADVQPWAAEPFFSQRANRALWYASAMEVVNPGNVPLDLSYYMLVNGGADGTPANAILANTENTSDAWNHRYNKYIPGRVWGNEASWLTNPAIAQPDFAVNPLVMGNDVFVVSAGPTYGYGETDVDIWDNPWNDTTITSGDRGVGGNPVGGWTGNTYYLFKILNDSVREGTKAANDPADYLLLDVFGPGDGSNWGGGCPFEQLARYIRKPNIWHGNPEYAASFGTNEEDSEWLYMNNARFGALGLPGTIFQCMSDLGVHTMDPVTFWRSYITSSVYKVSEGFSMEEELKGVVTGTTVDELIAGINKEDPGQTIVVKSGATTLGGSDAVSNGDVMVVTSADSENQSGYVLNVTEGGLSNNAVLTSSEFTIAVDGSTGSVTGMSYGIKLADVKDGVVVPAGASMTIIDAVGSSLPLKKLGLDTMYHDVMVSDAQYLEVVAEDAVTKIVYQLMPTADSDVPFVISTVYDVDQGMVVIANVERGSNVNKVMGNCTPSAGATMMIVDKWGNQRASGNIAQDDKLVVTKGDMSTTYYLSMLLTNESYGEANNYHAYVLSEDYDVDQLNLMISGGITGDDMRLDFVSKLTPAFGATMTVINKDGFESNADDLNQGDKVQVTSADGQIVVLYTIDFAVSVDELANDAIQLYPNPTNGTINIDGIESGSSIKVFNVNGTNVSSYIVNSTKATFSIDEEPAGLYFIVVETGAERVGSFKVIKK
jgi:hypothetical protein